MTSRIEALRSRAVSTVPEIFADRARIVTKSYQKTSGLPPIRRRAMAFAAILDEMEICLAPDELIVGSYAGRPRGCQVYPEYGIKFLLDEMDELHLRTSDRFVISEETKQELRELWAYWEGNTLSDTAWELFEPEDREAAGDTLFLLTPLRCGVGHMIVDYPRCLNRGIRSIVEEIQERRGALDFCDPAYADKKLFYDAAEICLEAMIRFAHRFACLAQKEAEAETGAERRAELEEIARICRRVPEYPAETFQEALQSFWLLQLCLHLEASGHSISPGRFDQYIFPFYDRDVRQNGLSREKAGELVQALWIKFFELNKVRDKNSTKAFGGYPMFQNLMVGGQDVNGRCAINELSHLCLEATDQLRLPQPSLSMRWYYGSPDAFLEKALRVIAGGGGMPALFNDEVLIPNMLRMGYSLEEARDYAIVGCTETVGQGNVEPWLTGGFINALKAIELAIFDGFDPLYQKYRPLRTGAVESMSWDAFYAACLRQLDHMIEQLVRCDNIMDALHARLCPTPMQSAFTKGCLENGRGNLEGGALHNSTTLEVVGMPNLSDSLVAIRKLVYEEKRISWETLKAALLADFEGYEDIRQMLVNKAPKYGNDDPVSDELAAEIVRHLAKVTEQYTSPRGGSYRMALYSISSHVLFAEKTGATPDGRHARAALADGGISCSHGRDRTGLTALLNTITAVDPARALGSALLNVKLAPKLLRGEDLEKVKEAIKVYFLKKGQHIQINVLDVDTLRRAQEHPDEYPALLVRVAGFSVFFTNIERQLQEDIIARTEHESGGGV